jgi:hypothetical protein
MGRGDFGRQWEHFYSARRALMAPHRDGEAQAFFDAFQACRRALFPSFDDGRVEDERAREALDAVRQFTQRGSLAAAASALTVAERAVFSEAVDTLATFFDRAVFCGWVERDRASNGTE